MSNHCGKIHHRILFLSVLRFIEQVYSGTIVADFPAGCQHGPGVGDGSDIKVMDGVCVYTIKGGGREESGIRIRSNEPGSTGSLLMLLRLTKEGEQEAIKGVLEHTEGWTHLLFKYGDIMVRFNPAPGTQTLDQATLLLDGSLYLPHLGLVSYLEVELPDKKKIKEGWFVVDGYAIGRTGHLGSMMYHYGETVKNGEENSTLHAMVALAQQEVPNGWYFDMELVIDVVYYEGTTRREVSESAVIARGHMFDKKKPDGATS